MNIDINALIVEDEPILAEVNAEFVQRNTNIKVVGIASTLHDAKIMLEKFNPQLVLLDNYLPDGQGIELFDYIVKKQLSTYIIFITAASDMDTCSHAIRHGAFDYLIKPVSYERITYSLNKFKLFLLRQSSPKNLSQRQIDELFNLQIKDFVETQKNTKGIDALTLQRIQSLFIHTSDALTVEDVVSKAQISKTTVRRYLEYCVQTHFLKVEIQYGKIGRPERYYKHIAI
ncbi:two-component system response regulator CitB [Orbus hercynius]|uniref:Transcriptional regulatory protein n=1 Tax=Orbus hercynius TaxID=593135 RepID=A0A495RJM0_9GAMM|nr:response regulator [Orbus hercynius]RKS87717.1 two-component system response regulator CitB [Orbus hercynius]